MVARQCSLHRAGLWGGPIQSVRVGTGLFTSVSIPAEDIAAVEIVGEQTKVVERGTSRSNKVLAGGLVFGVDGMLAGSLLGGKEKFREGTGTLSAVLRTNDGQSYAIDCTLKQAQAISAAIVSPSTRIGPMESERIATQHRDGRTTDVATNTAQFPSYQGRLPLPQRPSLPSATEAQWKCECGIWVVAAKSCPQCGALRPEW